MKVYNKHHKNYPADAVYIGRPTKWGNPYSHLDGTLAEFKVSSREEAIERYRHYLDSDINLQIQAKQELKGKSLICWCAPKSCHGEYLMEIANKD